MNVSAVFDELADAIVIRQVREGKCRAYAGVDWSMKVRLRSAGLAPSERGQGQRQTDILEAPHKSKSLPS
jgi:hypothetical protein